MVKFIASPKRAQFQLAAAHTDQYALGAHCFCSSSSFAFTCWRRSIAKLFRINKMSSIVNVKQEVIQDEPETILPEISETDIKQELPTPLL